MFKHYISSALRQLARNKFTSALNIACLAFGLMCFLGVYSVVTYLQNGDRHFANSDRVLAIAQQATLPGSQTVRSTMPGVAWVVADYLRTDFPELEVIARVSLPGMPGISEASLAAGEATASGTVRFADPEFFDVFALPLLAGDRTNALRQSHGIVISNTVATQLFGDAENALGKSVILYGATPVTVTGVLDSIPQPSHLGTEPLSNPFQRFDVLVTTDVLKERIDAEALKSWTGMVTATYVVLPKDGSLTAAQFAARLKEFTQRNAPPMRERLELRVMPLSSLSQAFLDIGLRMARSNFSSVDLLYILGGLVLLVTCLTYANLASAQAATRAREIGLRRTVGAGRRQIITQYLFEASFSSAIAAVIALCLLMLVLLAVPDIDSRTSAAAYFVRDVLPSPALWRTVLLTLCAVTLVAGAYPAFVLSKVRPIQAVRTGQEKTDRRRVAALIVGAQFTAASFLLISILVMQAQTNYMRRVTFATNADPMLVLTNNANNADKRVEFGPLREELLRQPHIKSVTAAQTAPWTLHGMIDSISSNSEPTATRRQVSPNVVNRDFFSTFEFKLLAGRVFDSEHALDDVIVANKTEGAALNVVIDQALAEQNGWTPQSAIDKTLYRWRSRNGQETSRLLHVIGVVDTKPLTLIGFGATASAYTYNSQIGDAIVVRVSRDDARAAVEEIDAVWKRLAPGIAIHRKFADETLNTSMWMFDMVSRTFGAIGAFALLIATLGLVGMSIHATHRRMHEIGVRKTIGASTRSILALLIKDFSKPVFIANLIAWPLAYVLMRAYLSVFTHNAGLSLAPFLASLAIALLVAWVAVSAQVIRAARRSAAEILRYE